ncbi:hypothetical protein ACJU26_02475 [Acidithiobacillus sp. M4-SHS-6]|uniref:hypothetical protein n=1 Tax=Acidithiobacillus sp. M4-SHS-6 TaxID=3383024 RepID=UPI0039BE1378
MPSINDNEKNFYPARSIWIIWVLMSSFMVTSMADGHVLIHSLQACQYLRDHAIKNHTLQDSARTAASWSGLNVHLYIEKSSNLKHVAHIPGAPYITAIAGKKAECVAATPTWFSQLTPAEQSWLWMVGIDSLEHPRIYHLMLHAAEHPPQGLFAGLEKWYGRRIAERSILKAEKQASRWLPPQKRDAAQTALVRLAEIKSFSQNKWLPSIKEQISAVN